MTALLTSGRARRLLPCLPNPRLQLIDPLPRHAELLSDHATVAAIVLRQDLHQCLIADTRDPLHLALQLAQQDPDSSSALLWSGLGQLLQPGVDEVGDSPVLMLLGHRPGISHARGLAAADTRQSHLCDSQPPRPAGAPASIQSTAPPTPGRMPAEERRRRAGAREVRLPKGLRDAFTNELKELRKVRDPEERIRIVGDLFAALDDPVEQLTTLRLEAVGELRKQGWTYDRLASLSGLSKTRIAQLARDERLR